VAQDARFPWRTAPAPSSRRRGPLSAAICSAPRGQIFASAVERCGGAEFEIGDPGVGGIQPPASPLVLGSPAPASLTVDGSRRIAHLLVG
jgi:hypothetical protein